MADTLKSLGLCLGASTVSLVQVERDLEGKGALSPHIIAHSVHSHEGDAKRCLIQALKDVELSSFDRITATGRKFQRSSRGERPDLE